MARDTSHLRLLDARGDYITQQADALAQRERERAESAHNRAEALIAAATATAQEMTPAQHVIAQSISLACASWLACFYERQAAEVSIQPLGGPEYEVSLRLAKMAVDQDDETIIAHCVLIVEPGKVLHVRVDPVSPARPK